jgi:hypothetical protein
VFSRSDTSTDSQRFYESVLEFLDDPEEAGEVDALLQWWNWYVITAFSPQRFLIHSFDSQIFPSFVTQDKEVTKSSALAMLKEKRAQRRRQAGA